MEKYESEIKINIELINKKYLLPFKVMSIAFHTKKES